MENQKVMVENLTNGRIGVTIPELHLRRTWERKGAKLPVELSVLKEAIYYPGVSYMFTQGMLGISDMKAKIELGLEEEGATEPQNIIILTDMQRRRLLTVAPISELKETLAKLPYEQVKELVNFAIDNKLTDYERCSLLEKITGTKIVKSIELKEANKEG